MVEVYVTRNGQITLSKVIRDELNIREGDRVTMNRLGDGVYITKKSAQTWDNARDFLPENFSRVLAHVRGDYTKRLRSLGVLE